MTGTTIQAQDIIKDMTLTVRLEGLQVVKVRLWVGRVVLQLAAWVIGCEIVVEER